MRGTPNPTWEIFQAQEYPEGRRCSCCKDLFEDGQHVVRHFLGDMWTYSTCEPCAEEGAPLCGDHPLRAGNSPTLKADGRLG